MSAEESGTQTQPDATQPATLTEQQPALDSELWKGMISASIANRKALFPSWKESVNYRVQKPFGSGASEDVDRIAVPEDWARTKQKQSQLMFQLPKIVARERRPEYAPSAGVVQAAVNDKLRREVKAAYMVDEVLADAINAAGLMISMVGVDIRTEQVPNPVQPEYAATVPDPSDPTGMATMPNPTPQPPMAMIDRIVYRKFYWKRISPAAFLWPAEFTGSNWDEAPWLGYEVWMPEALARSTFKLGDDYKCAASKPLLLSEDVVSEQAKKTTTNYVRVQVIWYKAALYDETVVHPEHLRRVVFLDGKDEPVEHMDTDWQTWIPEMPATPEIPPGPPGPDGQPTTPPQPAKPAKMGHYIGLTKFPIRVGTLTYVSDMAVPPSDSEAGRPQVKEQMRARSQMLRQRDSAIPIRWYDVNRFDETIAESIRKGEWNDMIPVNGPGERVIGEVSRANYPRESSEFRVIIGNDLDRAWSLSNNQLASTNSSERSAAEVNAVRTAGDIRADYEKEKVNRYIVEGAEVLFSLMQMFAADEDYVEVIGPDGAARLQAFTRDQIAGEYGFDFVADSSDRMSIDTKQANALKVFNLLGNSPSINRPELEKEIVELHGFDPARLVLQPKEPPPEKPNISFRFSGEDMLNPMAVSLLQKAGYNIGPDDITAAAKMIADAMKAMKTETAAAMGTMPQMPGMPGAPATQVADATVTPPETPSPILKRAVDGTHLT